jgi:hypothetical protein
MAEKERLEEQIGEVLGLEMAAQRQWRSYQQKGFSRRED